MPGDMQYAREKFVTAFHALAVGEGVLRERFDVARVGLVTLDAYQPGSGQRSMSLEEAKRVATFLATIRDDETVKARVSELADDLVSIAFALDYAYRR